MSTQTIYLLMELHRNMSISGNNIPVSKSDGGAGFIPVFSSREAAEQFGGEHATILEATIAVTEDKP